MKPSDAKKEILESIDAIQKVEGEVLNSSKDYKHQIYLEPLVKSFSKDKLEMKLKRAKYNVIPIFDLTKRIKETRENKNKNEKNKKKYIDIFVWVNYGSGVCANDKTKIEDVETKIGDFDDDKAKAEEVENLAGVNVESGVCADDEGKAKEVDTEIGECAADDEARAKEVDTKISVFDDNGTSKHQSQWDIEKLRGVIQFTPKVEEVIDQELMIAFNGGRFSLNESVFEHDGDDCVVFVG
ncbi:hypothetical protein Q3G72_014152 [Acer saccharum]|nr:hypothetical protein Q3G72_014152 [Acer saccharum]